MNRIIITTDIHGQYPNFNFSTNEEINYGLATISKEIQKLHDENTILIDNGDFFQGAPLMTNYFKYHPYENPSIKVMNYLNYDYYNFGNHDFNFGKDELLNFINNINAKVITTNVSIDNITHNYTMHTFKDGMKVALIGITTDFVNVWEQAHNLEGIVIKDSYQTLKEQIALAKAQNPDLIIGIYHGGIEKDLETGSIFTSTTGENQGYKFCETLGLDLLLTGHEHREIVSCINDIYVTQSANQAKSFIVVEFDHKKINKPQLIKACDLHEIDDDLNQLLSNEISLTNKWLDKPVVNLQEDLLIDDPYQARIYKHQFFTLINYLIKEISGCDITSCGFSYDAYGFSQNVTLREVYANFPFSNTIMIFKTKGKYLKQYLEHSLTFFVLDQHDNIIINPQRISPKNELYNYEMVDGIKYSANISKPFYKRLESVVLDNNQVVEDEKEYYIAMSNYRASGTGGYDMIAKMNFEKEIAYDLQDLLIDYFIKHPNLVFPINHNILLNK